MVIIATVVVAVVAHYIAHYIAKTRAWAGGVIF
jgi:hypothetical protein